MELLISVLFALPLYILPGLAVLQIFQFNGKFNLWDKLVTSIFISIVIVPYAFVAVGNFFHFIPNPIHLLAFSILLFIISLLFRRFDRRPSIGFIKYPDQIHIPRLERLFVWLFIIAYAIIANLPRIIMFVQGGQLMESSPGDEPWHIAELVSVARTGIPPMHYLFPDLKLAYYYAAWVYPAIVGNSSFIQVSLIRALAIHVFIVIFSFLAVIYYLIYSNVKFRLVRIAGILMFSIMGGFDLFAKLPGIEFIDWWPVVSRWITSNLQISQFTTLFVWVPHHVIAAMSFTLLLLVWRNLKSTLIIKAAISGILLGFCFITSPFVFMFSTFAITIIMLLNIKQLITERKQTLLLLFIVVLLFSIGGWYNSTLYVQQNNGGFSLRDFHVNVIEGLRGGSSYSKTADRILSVVGFPLLAGWIGVIELGLAFILYVMWIFKEFAFTTTSSPRPTILALAIFPMISMFLIFFIQDRGGGENFGMRGIIPAQICIVLAAIFFLDQVGLHIKLSGWQKWIGIYFFGCFLVAQSLSSVAEIREDAVRPVKVVMSVNFPVKFGLGEIISPNWPIPYDYIHWLNKNTPINALVLDNCPPEENVQYRFLERIRFIDPRCVPKDTLFFINDAAFIIQDEWDNLLQRANKAGNLLDLYSSSDWSKKNIPTYYVDHGIAPVDPGKLGAMVYQDIYVIVYKLK